MSAPAPIAAVPAAPGALAAALAGAEELCAAAPAPARLSPTAHRVETRIAFSGSALAKHVDETDDPAPAELSTVESTVASGVRHSLRTIAEAQNLIRANESWSDWSPAAREQRNRLAGNKKLGL